MAKFKFSDIDKAFEKLSSSARETMSIMLVKDTGEILCRSTETGEDQIEERETELETGKYAFLPTKNDLDLGHNLVFYFVSEFMSADYHKIRSIFRGRGAYRKYHEMLKNKGMLNEWQKFEANAQVDFLKEWCKENGIKVKK